MPAKNLEKEGKELLSPKPWFIQEREIDLEKQEAELTRLKLENKGLEQELDEERRKAGRRTLVLYVLLAIFAILIPITLAILIADGAYLIDMDTSTLNILAAALIGEIAGLLTIALVWLYKGRGS